MIYSLLFSFLLWISTLIIFNFTELPLLNQACVQAEEGSVRDPLPVGARGAVAGFLGELYT